jgi:hypothetical protein
LISIYSIKRISCGDKISQINQDRDIRARDKDKDKDTRVKGIKDKEIIQDRDMGISDIRARATVVKDTKDNKATLKAKAIVRVRWTAIILSLNLAKVREQEDFYLCQTGIANSVLFLQFSIKTVVTNVGGRVRSWRMECRSLAVHATENREYVLNATVKALTTKMVSSVTDAKEEDGKDALIASLRAAPAPARVIDVKHIVSNYL